jgi:hypothetical protein
MQPRNNLSLAVVGTVSEMRRGEVRARGSFGEAAMFNFILPVKEDA